MQYISIENIYIQIWFKIWSLLPGLIFTHLDCFSMNPVMS